MKRRNLLKWLASIPTFLLFGFSKKSVEAKYPGLEEAFFHSQATALKLPEGEYRFIAIWKQNGIAYGQFVKGDIAEVLVEGDNKLDRDVGALQESFWRLAKRNFKA